MELRWHYCYDYGPAKENDTPFSVCPILHKFLVILHKYSVAKLTRHVSNGRTRTDRQANAYTVENILGGQDQWDPHHQP